MAWRERWTFVSWANSSVGTQSCPTPPGRSAGRSDPTRPWYGRVLDSTGTEPAGFCVDFGSKIEVMFVLPQIDADRNLLWVSEDLNPIGSQA